VKAIRPEEAEETVASLRADLREADALRQCGDRRGYERARERAGKKMASIGKMLEYRFAQRAERHFGSNNPHMVREAVEEIYERLYRDLMDLSPKKRFYEENFNACAKWAAIDVIRRVKVRHGMRANVIGANDEEKRKDLKRQRALLPDSIQDREYRAEEGERVSLPEDQETLAAIEGFVGPNLIRDILARMPDHKHRKVLILHAIKRLTFEKTAEKVGVSEKTARRYYNHAVEIVKQVVRARS
jgi:DNA-directed RNA polymerase specialized sigma24 family protein